MWERLGQGIFVALMIKQIQVQSHFAIAFLWIDMKLGGLVTSMVVSDFQIHQNTELCCG